MTTRVGIIGLGKAGGSLRASLRAHRVPIADARRRLGKRALPDVDVLFLAVPDDALAEVDAALATRARLPALVVHLSGARGIEALPSLAERTEVGTFHPLASLDGRKPIPRQTLIAVDASDATQRRHLTRLAQRLGLHPAHVPSALRVRYHAGAVVSANLAVALLHEGVHLLVDAGVPHALARQSLARLLKSQAENAIAHELPDALTGPVARGDVGTVTRHLAALDDPELVAIYTRLTDVLARDVARLSPATRAEILRVTRAHTRRGRARA